MDETESRRRTVALGFVVLRHWHPHQRGTPMKPIRTRNDLLEIAARNAPTRACERTMREIGAIVFGGVTSPEGLPGWVVDVRSKWRDWLIGVWVDAEARTYRITYLDVLPEGARQLSGNLL